MKGIENKEFFKECPEKFRGIYAAELDSAEWGKYEQASK